MPVPSIKNDYNTSVSVPQQPQSAKKKNNSRNTPPDGATEDTAGSELILTLSGAHYEPADTPAKEDNSEEPVSYSSRPHNKEDDIDPVKTMLERLHDNRSTLLKAFDPKNKKISYNAASDLALLASVSTTGQVAAFKGRLRIKYAQISRSGGDSAQVGAILVNIKKVIQKANVKMKKLKQESIIDHKRKEAQQLREIEREKKLERELARRRKNRKAKEQNDILEAKRNGTIEDSRSGSGAQTAAPSSAAPVNNIPVIPADPSGVTIEAMKAEAAIASAGTGTPAAAPSVGSTIDVML